VHQFRETEIENFDPAVFGDEQVLRLEVTMDDALFMSRRQSMRNLNAVIDRLAQGYRTVLQQLPQSVALQQLGNQIGCSVKGAELVDGKDVGVIESRGRLGLLLKTMQPLEILRNKGWQDLDRDLPL
jgi:hypothetical protein